MDFDFIIKNGTVFDGTGAARKKLHIGVKDGKIKSMSELPLNESAAAEVIDAENLWVTPGFLDIHTHYDAELEFAPSLSESLRHGVTTIMVGSCSLGMVPGTPEVLSDIFCRVEAIPYNIVRPLLEEKKTWTTLRDYLEHLNQLNLGPNVACLLGHSALRSHVMGIERSLDKNVKPTAQEMQQMEQLTEEALDLGYVGLSLQTSLWDKMGGSREYRSKPLPSTFATWSEYRRLTDILRRRGAVLQGVPNLTTRVNVLLFMLESAGLFIRKKLKTTVISMMDVRSDRSAHWIIGYLSRFFNKFLNADFKWQSLPEVFDLWADGMDLVVFEEFGAGAAVLHFEDEEARKKLLADPEYRAWFKRQWKNKFLPKAFHRNLEFSEILEAPDKNLVGKSFTQLADEKKQDAVDVFLELMLKYGPKLRWYTVMGNDREDRLRWILNHPDSIIGFSDAGAHLRNMAHYNFPLRMLKFNNQKKSQQSIEQSVYKLTGELAGWFGLDAGVLAVGKRADIVLLDPQALDDRVDIAYEEKVEGIPNFIRLVRRNEGLVNFVFVNGKMAVKNDRLTENVGRKREFGQVLRAQL